MTTYPSKINHELDSYGNPIYIIRKAPLEQGAILYDKEGYAAAIKSKGRILAIIGEIE